MWKLYCKVDDRSGGNSLLSNTITAKYPHFMQFDMIYELFCGLLFGFNATIDVECQESAELCFLL